MRGDQAGHDCRPLQGSKPSTIVRSDDAGPPRPGQDHYWSGIGHGLANTLLGNDLYRLLSEVNAR